MISILTFPFYFIPLIYSLQKDQFSAKTFFFVYSFLGCWLLSALLNSGVVTEQILIASWVIQEENIPFTTMAIINVLIFVFSSLKFKLPFNKKTNFKINSKKKLFYVSAAFILVLLEFLITLNLYSGLSNWVASSYSRTVIEDSRVNFLFPFVLAVNVFTLTLYAVNKNEKFKNLTKGLLYLTISLQILYLALSGGRSILLLFLLSLVIINIGRVSTKGAIKLALIAALFVLVSGYMISERYKAQGADAQFDTSLTNIVIASYTGLPFIDHIALSQRYAEINGYDYGEVYVNAATSFIPRSMWPETSRIIWRSNNIFRHNRTNYNSCYLRIYIVIC